MPGRWKTFELAASASLAAVLILLAGTGCVRRSPEAALALRNQAAASEKAGKPWEAVVLYTRALQHQPEDVETRLRLADVQLDTGDYAAAQRNYRRVLKAEPENAAAINNLSWLYTQTGWHLDWAEKAMKPLAAQPSPHRHAYLDTLGMVFYRQGRYKEARASFQEAFDLCRKGVVMSTSGECARIEEHLSLR